jgi:hypothetical protein
MAVIGLGAVKARGADDAEFLDVQAPHRATLKAHGNALGSAVDVLSTMALSDGPDGTTELHWTADITILGTLASLAARLMGRGRPPAPGGRPLPIRSGTARAVAVCGNARLANRLDRHPFHTRRRSRGPGASCLSGAGRSARRLGSGPMLRYEIYPPRQAPPRHDQFGIQRVPDRDGLHFVRTAINRPPLCNPCTPPYIPLAVSLESDDSVPRFALSTFK